MDAFEQVVAEILWREGYWVRTSVKVELSKEEKRAINRRTSPRWELDVVAYRASDNQLMVVECKSYLDSHGVKLSGFDSSSKREAKYYKLFNDPNLREVVFGRLRKQFESSGACPPNAEIKLCLACGRIASAKSRTGLQAYFAEQGWELWDEAWLYNRLKEMSEGGYENQVTAIVSKLLLRGNHIPKSSTKRKSD